jgi:hypothetical protein
MSPPACREGANACVLKAWIERAERGALADVGQNRLYVIDSIDGKWPLSAILSF